jgi:hypothetical protein
MALLDTARRGAASAGGRTLSAATSALAAVRPAAKPLHPEGGVTGGLLTRFGADVASGAGWLDGVAEDRVQVRRSRAVGLPAPAPDIFGLALRAPLTGGGYGDLLFATTGLGRLTRFTLTPARTPYARPLTTLLPYRTASGPVLLSAVHRGEDTLDLAWAVGTGPWRRFASLRLFEDPAQSEDAPVSFDPVLNPLPGLEVYDWVSRLREPSYRTARRSRAAASDSASWFGGVRRRRGRGL